MKKQKTALIIFFTSLKMVNVKEFHLIPLSFFREGNDIYEFF